MTKNEVLELHEPGRIWDAMQENVELKKDREVWMHLFTADREARQKNLTELDRIIAADPNSHIDPLPRDRKKE